MAKALIKGLATFHYFMHCSSDSFCFEMKFLVKIPLEFFTVLKVPESIIV